MTSEQAQPTAGPFDDSLDPDTLVIDDGRRFRVHGRAYTDPRIFEVEMARVFESNWVFVAHESEIPNPGSYKTSYVGLQPVIVTRDDEGRLSVLLNRCRHRGSVVCREARGTAHYFRCPYHGWVYEQNGRLAGIAMRKSLGGYADDFEAPGGLFRLPRVGSYRGFVFASFNDQAVPLAEYLGPARCVIDAIVDRSPVGELVLASDPLITSYQGNWKFQPENQVDTYHYFFVHEGFQKLQERFGARHEDFSMDKGLSIDAVKKARATAFSSMMGSRRGHCYPRRVRQPAPIPDEALDRLLDGEFSDYYRQLVEVRGRERVAQLEAGMTNGIIFPNLGIIQHQIRVVRPLAVDRTEVSVYLFETSGAPSALNTRWMRTQERFYGPAGHGQPDDSEIFALNQQGLAATALDWLLMDRGIADEELLETGERSAPGINELPQRTFWRGWRRSMRGDHGPAEGE